MGERLQVQLEGVPETLVWTLYHRAVEARRPDSVLEDPMAVELVERLDYPFEQRFGAGGLGQCRAGSAPPAAAGGVRSGTGYRPPPWLWTVDAGEERRLAALHPNIAELRALRLPRGRGALYGFLLPLLGSVPAVRRTMLTVYGMRFGRPAA